MRGAGLSGLSVLAAVVRHGSLTRAAAALGVRPPAISYQLKMLEADIGTPLLTRTTRSLSLTDAGRALLERAGPGAGRAGPGTERGARPGAARPAARSA